MPAHVERHRAAAVIVALALWMAAVALAPAGAQQVPDKHATMEKLAGVWVDGPGYDITYGRTYEACAARCLATDRCRMIEFYRPERRCNLYAEMRTRRKGGSSDVGIRR